MQRSTVTGVAILAVLALGACHKSGSNAGKDLSRPGDSAPVNAVQDVTAGPMGMASDP